MIASITANELKVKGISAMDEMVGEGAGLVITVRGKEKYVILPISEYNQFRELELDAAIKEAHREIEEEKFHTGSVEEHLARIKDV